jgi:hypothetical protein
LDTDLAVPQQSCQPALQQRGELTQPRDEQNAAMCAIKRARRADRFEIRADPLRLTSKERALELRPRKSFTRYADERPMVSPAATVDLASHRFGVEPVLGRYQHMAIVGRRMVDLRQAVCDRGRGTSQLERKRPLNPNCTHDGSA